MNIRLDHLYKVYYYVNIKVDLSQKLLWGLAVAAAAAAAAAVAATAAAAAGNFQLFCYLQQQADLQILIF